jgi:hypothetical protein
MLNALPIGGGRRILEAVAELVRQTETELRALEPPLEDRLELEQHFLRPWSELAQYLESLLTAPRTRWLSANGAIELLEGGPPERPEDVDFCIAYGLDDSPEQQAEKAEQAEQARPAGGQPPPGPPPAHSGNGKA